MQHGDTVTVKKDPLAQSLARQVVGSCPQCDGDEVNGAVTLLTDPENLSDAREIYPRVVGAVFDCGHWVLVSD